MASKSRQLFIATLGIAALLSTKTPAAEPRLVTIFIVRHPETEPFQMGKSIVPLNEVGRVRTELLSQTLQDVKFTHMFATHTARAHDAIAPIAARQNLSILQFPAVGSLLDGKPVTDQTSRRAPIEPLSKALLKLPPGSVALVGLNSENIYAVLNKLGVPIASDGKPCSPGSMCVPCISNACFPRQDFDRIWYVLRETGRKEPIAFLQFRYGAGWKGTE
jgi:hypothetical protein